MFFLFTPCEPGGITRAKYKLNPKYPTLWSIIVSTLLIVSSVVLILFCPADIPATPVFSGVQAVSDPFETSTGAQLIPSEGEVVLLSDACPNGTYLSSISFSGTADSAWMKDEKQLKALLTDLTAYLGLNTDFGTVFSRYDKTYFKSNQLVALIMSKDDDLDCAYGGFRTFTSESDAIIKAETAIFSDIYAFAHSDPLRDGYAAGIQIDWKATQREQTGQSAWWLVLIGVDSRYSEILASCDHLSARWSNGFRPIYFKTPNGLQNITYNENETTFTDTYFVKTVNGVRSLYDGQDRFLINGDDFILMPHLIGVLEQDGWRLYKKSMHDPLELIAISDAIYEELSIERYPDGYTNNRRILAKRGGLWALLDNYGNELTEAVYDQIQYYSYEECRQVVCVVREGKYGAIDYDGNVVVEPIYTYISTLIYNDYDKDTYFVFDGNRWGILQLESNLTPNPPDWTAEVPKNVITAYENYHIDFD